MNETPALDESPPVIRARSRWWSLLGALVLVALVAVVYWPTLSGGFFFDDEYYIEHNAEIRTPEGLQNIWFDLGAFEQYYPLVYTTYWIEYHLWGLDPRGYHAVNMFLHALSAVLVWRVLRRLSVPGAWLAAAIFAVHPIQVESVALLNERKNVLSCALALASLLAFLRFAPPQTASGAGSGAETQPARGSWFFYGLSFVLFVAALLSKTVTAAVPAVLLVVYWWKQGRITLRDLARTAPFFALGIALSRITVGMEVALGASGKDWAFTPVERVLIAGRAFCYYVSKVFWPHPLLYLYSRWVIDPRAWWQYLYPAAGVLVVVVLWLARKRIGRGPLAAALIYGGVLLPGLGFFNLFMFRTTFVVDYYQYHASIGLIALIAAVAVWLASRAPASLRWAAPLAAAAILLPLAVVAHQYARVWQTSLTVLEDNAARDPLSLAVPMSLGFTFQQMGQYGRAEDYFQQAIAIREHYAREYPDRDQFKDDAAGCQMALAMLEREMGRGDDARKTARQAIAAREQLVQDKPEESDFRMRLAASYANLGLIEREAGEPALAEVSYRKALELREALARDNPARTQYQDDIAGSYGDLAACARDLGRSVEAEQFLRRAIGIREQVLGEQPHVGQYRAGLAGTFEDLGLLLQSGGRGAEAETAFRRAIDQRAALAADPETILQFEEDGQHRDSLGARRLRDRQIARQYQNALAGSHVSLGLLLRDQRRLLEAEDAFRRAIELREQLVRDDPAGIDWADGLAWCYIHLAAAEQQSGKPAVQELRRAIELREQLAAQRPAGGKFQNYVAASYVELGIVERDKGHLAEAEAAFRKSIEFRVPLVRDYPASTLYQAGLGWSYANLGVAQLAAGHLEAAVDSCQQAVDVREKLAYDNPSVPDYWVGLGWSHANLGVAQFRAGHPAAAETSHRHAIEERERLVRAYPEVAQYTQELAISLRDLGNVQVGRGQIAEAIATYRQAIELREKLAQDPSDQGASWQLALDLALCGDALAQSGQWSEAAELYARVVGASNAWQHAVNLVLLQWAAGNEHAYRAAALELTKRYNDDNGSDAALLTVLALVVGDKAIDDMQQVVTLATREATSNRSNPLAVVLLGASQLRAGQAEQAVATLTSALPQLDPGDPLAALAPDQSALGRLIAVTLLARAAYDQPERPVLEPALAALRQAIAAAGAAAPPDTTVLPRWSQAFGLEFANRELARLTAPPVSAPSP